MKVKRNQKLNDNDSCEIYVYHNIDFQLISTIIGKCKENVNLSRRDGIFDSVEESFLSGIQSMKYVGYITKSRLEKIISIENKYNIDFAIPKQIKNFIKINS